MRISVCINCDTRSENLYADQMFDGTRHSDYLTHAVWNKLTFFREFNIELILCIDQHKEIHPEDIQYLKPLCSTLVIRNHTHEPKFNDYNYIRCLSLATGDIVVHFDQDSMAFAKSPQDVKEMIALLDKHTVVSYPHWLSPNPDHNDNYDYWWASTRFFMCKREFLDVTDMTKCMNDMDYMYKKYPASVKNPWLEHYLGLKAKYEGNGVFYPPMTDNILIFSWKTYKEGTIPMLNNMSYQEVIEWQKSHPIFFPNDINA